jgi:DNA-binding transcriptional ArsR family regulator
MIQDHLSLTFAALADPTRRAMLARLSKGEASVSDLAKPFLKKMSLPAITKHIQVLERAGLVSKSREGQYRPCKLKADGFRDATEWVDQYRAFWEESFNRLDVYLKETSDAYLKETASTRKRKEKKHGTSKE